MHLSIPRITLNLTVSLFPIIKIGLLRFLFTNYNTPNWTSPPYYHTPYLSMNGPTNNQQNPPCGLLGGPSPWSSYPLAILPVLVMQHMMLITPIELGHSLATMSLNPPDDGWYMDSWPTSHLTHNTGNLMRLFNLSTPNYILPLFAMVIAFPKLYTFAWCLLSSSNYWKSHLCS